MNSIKILLILFSLFVFHFLLFLLLVKDTSPNNNRGLTYVSGYQKSTHFVDVNSNIKTVVFSSLSDKNIQSLNAKSSLFLLIIIISSSFLLFIIKINGIKGEKYRYRNFGIPLSYKPEYSMPYVYKKLSEDVNNLFKFTYKELIDLGENKLKYEKLFQSVLDNFRISLIQFDERMVFFNYYEQMSAIVFFCKKIEATYSQEGIFYRIYINENFDLNINTFLLYYTNQDITYIKKDIINLNDKVLVISKHEYQDEIYKLAKDKTNMIIAPSLEQLNKLILSNESQTTLIDIFIESLLLKDISPYQLNGDVKSESNFFGRVEILREIISNDSVNYLIVGARQLGKSSILKALERRYALSAKVECYYITLKDSELLPSLAEVLGLEEGVALEGIVQAIKAHEKRPIFLIDEADEFVQHEKESNYQITSLFRKLSQEGDATFILAGFWTLYEYVTLDYQSPLKNFGKLITLEGLEKEACRELMIEPMKRIGISYESEALVEETVKRCGYRANYIAIVCDVVLRRLDGSVVGQKDIKEAFDDGEIEKMLKGWGSLSADKEANRLDRLIVYLTIEKESFRLGDVVEGLEEHGLEIDIERVTQSLDRLVLGYVVGKHKGNYRYQIPLLTERLLEDDLSFLIRGEVKVMG